MSFNALGVAPYAPKVTPSEVHLAFLAQGVSAAVRRATSPRHLREQESAKIIREDVVEDGTTMATVEVAGGLSAPVYGPGYGSSSSNPYGVGGGSVSAWEAMAETRGTAPTPTVDEALSSLVGTFYDHIGRVVSVESHEVGHSDKSIYSGLTFKVILKLASRPA